VVGAHDRKRICHALSARRQQRGDIGLLADFHGGKSAAQKKCAAILAVLRFVRVQPTQKLRSDVVVLHNRKKQRLLQIGLRIEAG
jgi:hypothetical protein